MKNGVIVLRNMFLLTFLVFIFGNAIVLTKQGMLFAVLVSAIFGVLMAAVPTMLSFFKINETFGSILLMSVVLSFIYFFALDYILMPGAVNATNIVWGLGIPSTILAEGATIVIISLLAAFLSSIMESLSEN